MQQISEFNCQTSYVSCSQIHLRVAFTMFLTLCLMNLTLIVPALNRTQRRHSTRSFMHVHVQIEALLLMWPKCTVHFIRISHPGSSSGSGVHLDMLSPRVQAKLISHHSVRLGNCGGKADPTRSTGRKPFLDHDQLDLAQGH